MYQGNGEPNKVKLGLWILHEGQTIKIPTSSQNLPNLSPNLDLR